MGSRTTESINKNHHHHPPLSSYFPLSLNPSVSTHELLFWHTQVDKHTHGLLPPPMLFFYRIAPLLPHFSVSAMLPVITTVSRIKLRSVALHFPLSRQLVGREWIYIFFLLFLPSQDTPISSPLRCVCLHCIFVHICRTYVCLKGTALLLLLLSLLEELEGAFTLAGTCAY